MQRLHKNILVLLLCIILFLYESDSLTTKEPLWSWECENEKCIPFKVSQTRNKLQSLETCIMLCSAALLWPLPTGQLSLATTALPVRSDLFEVEIVQASTKTLREYLLEAFQLFKQDLQNMEGQSGGVEEPHNVIIRFSVNGSEDPAMRMDTDESYQLSIEPTTSSPLDLVVEIVAHSFCGARHALETLSQLIWLDHYMRSLLIIQEALVNDEPRFGYRGLMIDTARNYIPFREILSTVDAMAASKLNTLHWHASDSQAFSIQLNSVAELAWYGANSPSEVYTTSQVQQLVHRARLRGIRVIIEIDTPAHVGYAWDWGEEKLGDLVKCVDSMPWDWYCDNPPCGQLNPLNPVVLEVLEKVYTEIIQLTGVNDIFHLGGDDVSDTCWMEHFNGSDSTVLWLEFTRSVLQRLEDVAGKSPNLTIFWFSRVSDRIKTDLVDLRHHIGLQMRDATWAKKYTKGLRTVLSHEDAWDLNSGYGTWYDDKSKAQYNSWQRFYEHRPWFRNAKGLIEGGEATLWSWTVSEGGLDARVWPRAAALAERLWTDRAQGATRSVSARLDRHRSRLVMRGVQCAPVWSLWCTQNPNTCN